MMVIGPTVVAEPPDRLVVSPPAVARWHTVPLNLFLVVWCIFWDAGALSLLLHWLAIEVPMWRVVWSNPREDFGTGVVAILFPAIGAGMSLWVLDRLVVRRAWVIEPGCIARRTRVPLLGLVRERRYADVHKIELRRGTWNSGREHTDTLRFWAHGGRKPIELTGVAFLPRLSIEDFKRQIESGESELSGSTLDAELAAFGESIATRVGVPFERVEERIPEPSSD